jgi:hypothetical protein
MNGKFYHSSAILNTVKEVHLERINSRSIYQVQHFSLLQIGLTIHIHGLLNGPLISSRDLYENESCLRYEYYLFIGDRQLDLKVREKNEESFCVYK